MSGHRKKAMLALAAASLAATLAPNAVAAAEPSWNGQYLVTLSANAKTGTSMAANRPEYPHKANYTFSSRCASDVCIATVVDAPPPKNEFIPRPIEYTWNGLNGYGRSAGNGTACYPTAQSNMPQPNRSRPTRPVSTESSPASFIPISPAARVKAMSTCQCRPNRSLADVASPAEHGRHITQTHGRPAQPRMRR